MQPHQERVVTERNDLEHKLDLLNVFIDNSDRFSALDIQEQDRMRRQAYAMRFYSDVLAERIAAFK